MNRSWVVRKLTPKQAFAIEILIKSMSLKLSGYTFSCGVIPDEGICYIEHLDLITTGTVVSKFTEDCIDISYEELIEKLEKEIKSNSDGNRLDT